MLLTKIVSFKTNIVICVKCVCFLYFVIALFYKWHVIFLRLHNDLISELLNSLNLVLKAQLQCRENCLSPVIQATWEARTVGWLEVEWLLPSDKSDSVAALWPP